MIRETEYSGDLKKEYTFDDQGNMTVKYEQDPKKVLEQNKIFRDDIDQRKNDMWLGASIPMEIVLKWKIEHGVDVFNKGDMKKVKQLLNEEYPHLKTINGRI